MNEIERIEVESNREKKEWVQPKLAMLDMEETNMMSGSIVDGIGPTL